jgi:hypothetical protein
MNLSIITKYTNLLHENNMLTDSVDTCLKLWTDKGEDLTGKKRAELQEMCKNKNLKTTGTKSDLIERLSNPVPVATVSVKNPKKRKTQKTIPAVLQRLADESEIFNIRRNLFGKYEHIDSGLVFDEISQHVIGKQDVETGQVLPLTERDIETCKEYNFSFDLPETIH